MIDLTPFEKAVGRLQSAIREQAQEPERLLLRAGLIQTFEYTFELSHRFLWRYLTETEPSPEAVAELTFEGLIRRADELGLVSSPIATWKDFRQARTDTSHTYIEQKAVSVVARIPEFAREAEFLFKRLKERTR
ncbi:MAG TPA: HI0074 family nucleotidyltransferase substrate-binding subunit [Acidobacteriaceae bacterium]|jgi:nucleotidyltransferase substrate binding protein (TIGR01987 family)|nr:HI0074 family nucleotidyltransferase substrate-binding subunit [Acidobacteriaceae bacterium]